MSQCDRLSWTSKLTCLQRTTLDYNHISGTCPTHCWYFEQSFSGAVNDKSTIELINPSYCVHFFSIETKNCNVCFLKCSYSHIHIISQSAYYRTTKVQLNVLVFLALILHIPVKFFSKWSHFLSSNQTVSVFLRTSL